jgi:DNA-binding transcriptional ArsR family regulator
MAVTGKKRPTRRQEEVCRVPCFNEELVARLRAMLPADSELAAESTGLQAFADPTRLKILLTLKSGEDLCVCDLAHVLGLSVSATSHQLRLLRALGFVRYRNDGRMVYYSLAAPDLLGWLEQGRTLLKSRHQMIATAEAGR